MKDRMSFQEPVLPPDLAALDAELSSLRYEERPSFGPELEAELGREWSRLQGRRYWPIRQLMAAALAGVLMVGLGVPSARAAIIRFVGSLQGGSESEEVLPTVEPTPAPVALPFEAPQTGEDEAVVVVPPVVSDGPSLGSGAVDPYTGPEASYPELRDRSQVEALIRRNYPMALQRAGIGGTVRVMLWVDSTGAVDFVNLGRSSGVPELDRAALQVAPGFRFDAARRRGRSVGTWVEFDVRFEPRPRLEEDGLPEVGPLDEPAELDVTDLSWVPEWPGVGLSLAGGGSAEEALRAALGDGADAQRLGALADILLGEPPEGVAPSQWRADVAGALESALARTPDNPAPFLALARIRQKQGLRTEARVLLERGLQRVQRSPGSVPPAIVAGLHYERGLLVKEAWHGARGIGRLPAEALETARCPQARSSGSATGGYASADRLIAWNYLCPEELGESFASAFELMDREAASDRVVALASFRSAVEAVPEHHGANVEILLALADESRWSDLLGGAMRFVRSSGGDPNGLLLAGLALQRLSRSEEARDFFERALTSLPEEEANQVEDLTPILVEPELGEYRRLSRSERRDWARRFWGPLDPILATAVNEREVEHLARSTYAYLRFGSVQSDASEVWIRYGRPEDIRALGAGDGVRTEFWDFGPGPDLTFRRLPHTADMGLTSEGRAYLDEVRQVVPHRYGNGSRAVFALTAQVSRFRDADGAGSEVTLNTRVPGILATGARDSLDLSLVLLGQGGDPLSSSVRRIPAVEGDVSMGAAVPGAVSGVVVEFYSPNTGQAAVLRTPLPAMVEVSGASMSDLVLTAPASPRRQEVARGGAWMEPLPLDQPVASHAIGVFLEVYGVESVASWYRLRAEIQDRATGEIRDLSIQPAGESGFRATWDRRPTGGQVTPEFLSVWLSDVPPGRYLLRIVADVPDAGAPLVAEQEFDRR
ncbi:MAG TPA: energy transducer TonB [Longimicrobiales bacterium]|nr:energy transducer TonB [Longimicrobiales bacterium]